MKNWLEKYIRENCSLHVLSLLGQNPDDPITSKDFRYIVTFFEQIISERDKEILDYINKNYSRSSQPLYAHVDAVDLAKFITNIN